MRPLPPAISFRCLPFEALSPAEIHAIFQLRTEVFIVEQNCPYQDVDGHDPFALHLLGHEITGTEGPEAAIAMAPPPLLCYARLLPVGLGYPEHAAIGRVITQSSVRGMGLGRILMQAALQQVDHHWNTPPVRLGAQDYAIPFYEGLGFQCLEHRYVEDGIPHTTMERAEPGHAPSPL